MEPSGKERKFSDEQDIPKESEHANLMWTHLIAKPSEDDLKYDAQLKKSDPSKYIPMTTRKEIWSWYLYDIARNPFALYMLALIYPLYLSTITTRYGCIYNTPNKCDYYNNPILASSSTLVVYIGEWSLKPESFATLMISFSGILQLICFLFISSIADYSNYQSYLFKICVILASTMVIIFFFIPDSNWLFAGLWGATLLVPIGLAAIFYNAYLPLFVENHWLIRRLQRKYKNKNDMYHNKHKQLIQSIQDDISQYGYLMGYASGVIAGIFVGIGLFLLQDITTEITNIYGINHQKENYDTDENEYWMKPVIGVDVWHSNIVNKINNESISYINGIRLMYGDIYLNGSIYGTNNISTFIFNENITSISFFHSSYIIDQQYPIIQINLYQSNNSDIINGIEFIVNNGHLFAGDITGDITQIKPTKYPNYELSGYKIYDGMYTDSNHTISMPVIYGYSFGFMDIDSGQYGNTFDNRLIYSLCGVWCLLFAIPAFFILKTRKKPPIPKSSSIYTVSLKDYYKIFRQARSYPNLFCCLIAWFIWSDAQNTTATVGALFAQIDLNMDSVLILIFLLEVQLLAVIGTILFVWLGKKFNLTNKNLLVIHLLINSVLPIWMIFGLFEWAQLGMIHVWEFFVIGGLFYGSQLGSLFSSSRSLYGHLIPIGYESQFFGLYEVTNKGSSWIGPLLATFISNTYSLRYALIYVLIFYIIAIPVVQFGVNYEKGMIQAGKIVPNDIQKPLLIESEDKSIAKNDDVLSLTEMSMIDGVESYGSTYK